jgi:hypothetical protein
MKRVPIPPGVPKFIHKGSLLAFKVYMYHIRGRLIDKNFFVVRLLLINIFRTLSDNPTLGVRTRSQKHVKKKQNYRGPALLQLPQPLQQLQPYIPRVTTAPKISVVYQSYCNLPPP